MTEGLFEITLIPFYRNTLKYKNKKFHIGSGIFVIPPRIPLIDSHDDPFCPVILYSFYHFIKKASKVNSKSTSRLCKFLMDRYLCLFLRRTVPRKTPCRKHVLRCLLVVMMPSIIIMSTIWCEFPSHFLHLSESWLFFKAQSNPNPNLRSSCLSWLL